MSTYAPIITNSIPPLQVSMAGGISYNEFVYMLGVLNLNIREFFLETGAAQINQNYQYTSFDSTGNANQHAVKPRKDPFQKQNSQYVKPGSEAVVLNGLSYLSFNLLPRQMLSMILSVDQTDPGSLSPGRNLDNFTLPDLAINNIEKFEQQKKTGR